jgi:isoleucyl-tRNA synthetase
VSNGLVLDKAGQKMSKRLGNAIDPFKTLNQFGPDATRWYLVSNANPWDNLKFDVNGIAEVQRKFFGTLYNTYSFFSLYANIDDYDPKKETTIKLKNRAELDRWILSELHSLIQEVDTAYLEYEPTKASRAISDFVQEKLSNWYVRLCRRRFWKGEYGSDKIAAYQTLHECLVTIAQLAAPIAPFYTDQLYRDLMRTEQSIHLTDFPKVNPKYIDQDLEEQINTARTLTSLALSLRKKEQIKVRQPLQKMIIPVKNEVERQRIERITEQLKAEINIKEVELLDDANSLLVKEVKPNFKQLGPRFGKDVKVVVGFIQNLTSDQINQLEEIGSLEFQLNEKNINLVRTDIEVFFKDIEGWQVAQGSGMTVALDITLTEELKQEGIARELVNRIQNFRKDNGLEVIDKIAIYLEKEPQLEAAVVKNKQHILLETLAMSLTFETSLEGGVELEFEDIKTAIRIKKIS